MVHHMLETCLIFCNSHSSELRGHLKKLQSLAVQIPEMVIESFVRDHSNETEAVVERIKKENDETIVKLETQRVCAVCGNSSL